MYGGDALKVSKENFVSDDAIMAMAMAGAGLTALGVALGAANVTEQAINTGQDQVEKLGNIVEQIANKIGLGQEFDRAMR